MKLHVSSPSCLTSSREKWYKGWGDAQWERALAALAKDLGVIPRTNMEAREHLYLQSIQHGLLASTGNRHA